MNSPLVNYTKISPNYSKRTGIIGKITIHHMAGNMTVERCGETFARPERQASSNYGIGTDGRVGMYVEEQNRAWTSSNFNNDNVAVTIEVANDGGAPDWHISDKAMARLIDLCVDICKRNGIRSLNFTGDKTGNLTMHSFFSATACPGPYLKSKFPYIAEQVNARLNPPVAPVVVTPVAPKKSIEEVAREVIKGTWGNGADRKARLQAEGYDYATVQAMVSSILNGTSKPAAPVVAPVVTPVVAPPTPVVTSKSTTDIAKEVIKGMWGSGGDRKNRITAAGYNYSEVQAIVNKLMSK